jgi:hypothetical protein
VIRIPRRAMGARLGHAPLVNERRSTVQTPASRFRCTTLFLAFLALALSSSILRAETTYPALPAAQHDLRASDLLARLRSWLNVIWPQNGCSASPNGVVHCGPDVVGPSAGQRPHPLARLATEPVVLPQNGCTGNPDGVVHCGPDVVAPSGH